MPTFDPRPRLDPDRDHALVESCRRGDQAAWARLVERHERLVYAVGRSYRLSDEELGDVFQEVFAALVRGLPRLKDGRALVRWLASTTQRIARTTALRRRREQARQAIIAGTPAEPWHPAGPVGADLERLEEQALVRLALTALDGRCRRLLEALYYEHPAPSYAELSRRLVVPIGSLGPTRARCFERLRRDLAARLATDRGITETRSATSGVERESDLGARGWRGSIREARVLEDPA
ncbi:MAG: sigma-70 family RNA polymerase sigma factor [Candidatus Eisenbacteria bacterium]|uniref:Sigma-70 family RNA polymerase sigma factor n=1 Tax=Eiseniibacteriota bacterium TaxID=2212470 RepID=A0A849SD66_UNCEI|nr:sigma-70 family RNA polymerase sigma factor [Candidatus Eisenbacteria bacterium]